MAGPRTPRSSNKPRSVTPREKHEPLDREERDARAAAMMARRLQGDYKGEIAKRFQLTVAEVNQELDYAKRRALHTKALDFITVDLMPKALAVYGAALDEGNVEVATKVLEGLGIIGAKAQGINLIMGSTDSGQDTFEAWRLKVSRAAQEPIQSASTVSIDVQPLPLEQEKDA